MAEEELSDTVREMREVGSLSVALFIYYAWDGCPVVGGLTAAADSRGDWMHILEKGATAEQNSWIRNGLLKTRGEIFHHK